MTLRRRAAVELDALRQAGRLRQQLELDVAAPEVRTGERSLLSFASNDYLGLARDPELARAAAAGAERWGTGAGASRLVTGHLAVHARAEEALATWLKAPSALLFASGYAANVGVLQALVGAGDLVVSDALNHASIVDGCRLSRAKVLVFRHGDLTHAEALLREHRASARHAVVVSDSIFSMDGDRADVRGLRALADRHDAALILDEAHALGVVGPQGRGVAADQGVVPDVLVGTLGKALGLGGAFAVSDVDVLSLLVNRARSYVFSTALTPPIAAAVPVAVSKAAEGDVLRTRLATSAARMRSGLRAAGWSVLGDDGPILPVMLGADALALEAAAALDRRHVLVRPIRPPTVPEGGARLRVTVSAAHTPAQIERAIAAFAEVR